MSQTPKTESELKRWLKRNKTDAAAWAVLGGLQRQNGETAQAVRSLKKAVTFGKKVAAYYGALGLALIDDGLAEDAEQVCRDGLAINAVDITCLVNLGCSLNAQRRFDAAWHVFHKADAIKPNDPTILRNIGVAHEGQGDKAKAETAYRHAIAAAPVNAEAHYSLACLLFRNARLKEAFHEYEWRRRLPSRKSKDTFGNLPLWDGRPLGGKPVIVHWEQGLGDTLNFIRFLDLAAQRDAKVIFECQPLLTPFLKDYSNAIHVIASGETRPFCVARAPLLSLPHLLGINNESDIPAPTSYLSADPQLSARWAKEIDHGPLNVGVAWQGSRKHPEDALRSIPIKALFPLFDVPNTRFYSLQKGERLPKNTPLKDPLGANHTGSQAFLDTAAFISNLDLVITVDTAVAHLAGALGVPVWVFVHSPGDWRWFHEGTDTVWYPSMKLFRQQQPGDWEPVLDAVRSALSSRATAP